MALRQTKLPAGLFAGGDRKRKNLVEVLADATDGSDVCVAGRPERADEDDEVQGPVQEEIGDHGGKEAVQGREETVEEEVEPKSPAVVRSPKTRQVPSPGGFVHALRRGRLA